MKRIRLFIASSILLSLYLSYIDEGLYSFAWMRRPGDWIAFFIYIALFTSIQLGTYSLVKTIKMRTSQTNKVTI